MDQLYLLAVYGDLRKGGVTHNQLLKDQTHIGDFDTEPNYSMYSFITFPALVKAGNTSIKMEVYEITGEVMEKLNKLQAYEKGREIDNMYALDYIDTPYGNAVIYLYNRQVYGKVLIETGDWMLFKQTTKENLKLSKYGLE